MSDSGDRRDGAHAGEGSSEPPLGGTPARATDVPAPFDITVVPADERDYLGQVPPPMPAPQRRSAWTFIDRQDALARVAARLASMDVIAIDAEFVQLHDRGPDDPPHRLALLQLAGGPGEPVSFVVDALRLPDLAPLQSPLGDARILKLFHGMGADVRVLASRGLVARHTLDLEAVSRSIFGQRESGLQAMLQRARGIYLDKSLQRSDWTRRPLPTAMLAYAARDAEMTLALYAWLSLHYGWATALHEEAADAPAPDVAEWIIPFLEGSRPQRVEWPPADSPHAANTSLLAEDLRAALEAVHRPAQRARLLRAIADLEIRALVPDIRPLVAAPFAEERAAAARALGRLRDQESSANVRALFNDPVFDVRQAARLAAAHISGERVPHGLLPRAPGRPRGNWTSDAEDASTTEAPWQLALRARFLPTPPAAGTDPPGVGQAGADQPPTSAPGAAAPGARALDATDKGD